MGERVLGRTARTSAERKLHTEIVEGIANGSIEASH
jgi:hypothetical protein